VGFERLNADVRWTSACRRSRRRQHHNFRQRRKCKRIPYPPFFNVQLSYFREGFLHGVDNGFRRGRSLHTSRYFVHSTLSRVTNYASFAIITAKEAVL